MACFGGSDFVPARSRAKPPATAQPTPPSFKSLARLLRQPRLPPSGPETSRSLIPLDLIDLPDEAKTAVEDLSATGGKPEAPFLLPHRRPFGRRAEAARLTALQTMRCMSSKISHELSGSASGCVMEPRKCSIEELLPKRKVWWRDAAEAR